MNLKNDLVIFEMANNHQGSVEHGKKIIKSAADLAKKYNVRSAIKFQFRNLETFIHDKFKKSDYVKHIKRFESTELSIKDFSELIVFARQNKIEVISTPFDEVSVETCVKLDVDYIKIASASSDDWPLLESVAKTSKPLIISTGGKTVEEIDNVYNFMFHRKVDFALMHCVSEYPTQPQNLQLNFIDLMKKRYKVPIGYSGHESPDNHLPSIIALSKGAQILERHVGLSSNEIKLNAYSLNKSQIEEWLRTINDVQIQTKLKNEKSKHITESESSALASLKRGIYAKKPLLKGEKSTFDNIYFAMPLQPGQLSSSDFQEGVIFTKDYKKDAPILEKNPTNKMFKIRKYIHSTKALLNESGLEIGELYNVELSHHYGIDEFNNYGATIINLINREYCKKLIIVLPGQKHPCHYHKIKEETFQLLFGDLNIILNTKNHKMKLGEIITIKRNDEHAFESYNGAIFEEISTTHHIGDSYYCDKEIQKKDLMERKTYIESW